MHRVNGDDAIEPRNRERALNSHLFNAAWKRGTQQLSGYGYLHEDRDVATSSSATLGLRWTGSRPLRAATLGWALEAARQRDHANNPQRFSHAYWLVEPSITARGITARAGWEHLGGNGMHALQLPLATLHAFNGWADKFLITPAGGLEDRYIGANGKFEKFSWSATWHDYRADTRMPFGRDYGCELDLSLTRPLRSGWTGLVKFADYRSDGFARDTRKLWLQVQWTH